MTGSKGRPMALLPHWLGSTRHRTGTPNRRRRAVEARGTAWCLGFLFGGLEGDGGISPLIIDSLQDRRMRFSGGVMSLGDCGWDWSWAFALCKWPAEAIAAPESADALRNNLRLLRL